MSRLPYYKIEVHKGYNHSLYQMSYPHWTYKCYSTDDGFPVTPSGVRDVIGTAQSLKSYAVALLVIVVMIATLIGFNMLLHLLNSKSFIKNSRARGCSYVRLLTTFLLSLIATGLLAKMFLDSDP